MTNSEEDHFNESLIALLNGQQDLQKQSLNMMQDITQRHEYDNLIRHIPIYDGKNMELADWLLQIEKVALLSHSQENKLAKAKSTSTPYKMLKRIDNNANWEDIKRKLEEVYIPIATEVHTASDIHQKKDQMKHPRNTYKIL